MKSRKITYVFIIIILVYSIFCIKNNLYKTKYSINDNLIEGTIKNIKIDGNKIQFYIDDLIVNYYCVKPEELEKYQIGDRLKIKGEISIPREEENFYLFNYRNYLLSQKIHYAVNAETLKIVSTKISYKYKFKRMILRMINKRKVTPYLRTFILGDNSLIDEKVIKSYQSNGISHLFSVSGMHVSLFTTILFAFFNRFRCSKVFRYVCLLSVLCGYAFLTNFTPSIIRASILFVLCMLNKDFQLQLENDQILMYIFGYSLLYNPFYLYNNGFLFSYIISFFLLKYKNIFCKYRNYFMKLFMISFICFVTSIPIMINSYYNINVLTPIFNLLFVPLVSFVVFPLSLLTIFFPFLDELLYFIISFMEFLSLQLSKFNYFNITLCHISAISFIIYYSIIIFIVNKMNNNEYKYIIGVFIIIFIHHNIGYFDRYATISFINVGQGDSILLTLPHNRGNILIDCSNNISFDNEKWKQKKTLYNVGDSVIIPYLKAQGINRLDYVMITHGDYDHIGSLDKIINEIKIKKVIFNSGNINSNEAYIINKLNEEKIKYYNMSKGKVKIDKYELLFLNNKNVNNENEDSLVIYFNINDIKVLLMGDAGFETEKKLIEEYNLRNLDILKVGHHGSKYSSSDEFIKTVNPKYSVISVGENNKFGHPDTSVIKKLASSKTYLTSKNGSVKFILQKPLLVNSVR